MTDQRGDPYARVVTEFPDYDLMSLPAVPPTWQDISWRNDVCPSFDTGQGLHVFIDYADPYAREFSDAARFTVTRAEGGDLVLATDDWQQVMSAVLR